MQVGRLDHIAIAVESLHRALELYRDLLGGEFVGGGDHPALGIRIVQLQYPNGSRIELMMPISTTSYLREFLDKHGEGAHHVTFHVDDVLSAASELNAAGFPTVGTDVSVSSWHETFLKPRTSFGLVVQVARPQEPWESPPSGVTLEEVLNGEVLVTANVVRRRSLDANTPPAPP